MNVEYDETKGQLTVLAYTTSVQKEAKIQLTLPGENGGQGKVLYEEVSDMSPEQTCKVKVDGRSAAIYITKNKKQNDTEAI